MLMEVLLAVGELLRYLLLMFSVGVAAMSKLEAWWDLDLDVRRLDVRLGDIDGLVGVGQWRRNPLGLRA